MSKVDKSTRISDIPSEKQLKHTLLVVKFTKAVTGLLKKLSIANESIEHIHRAVDSALGDADIVNLPDRFNYAFSNDGWIATGSMSVDTMRQILGRFESEQRQEAEDVILSWVDRDRKTLLAVNRAKRFNEAKNRWEQLQEALRLTFEERYWSAVPLILIACDGVASDDFGSSPFEKDAILPLLIRLSDISISCND